MSKGCQWCDTPLSGRQEKWCSEDCKVDAFHASKADYYLSALPQKEFREAIRRACEKRWKGKRGRLSVRFGLPGMTPGGPGPRH